MWVISFMVVWKGLISVVGVLFVLMSRKCCLFWFCLMVIKVFWVFCRLLCIIVWLMIIVLWLFIVLLWINFVWWIWLIMFILILMVSRVMCVSISFRFLFRGICWWKVMVFWVVNWKMLLILVLIFVSWKLLLLIFLWMLISKRWRDMIMFFCWMLKVMLVSLWYRFGCRMVSCRWWFIFLFWCCSFILVIILVVFCCRWWSFMLIGRDWCWRVNFCWICWIICNGCSWIVYYVWVRSMLVWWNISLLFDNC